MSEQRELNDAQLALSAELEEALTERYGIMLNSSVLWKELGYSSTAAFRVAVARGSVELPLFSIANRKGKFALSKDVAEWVSRQRHTSLVNAKCHPV